MPPQRVQQCSNLICMSTLDPSLMVGLHVQSGDGAHEVDLEHGDELLHCLDHALGGVGAGAHARRARHPVLRLVHRRPRPHQVLRPAGASTLHSSPP